MYNGTPLYGLYHWDWPKCPDYRGVVVLYTIFGTLRKCPDYSVVLIIEDPLSVYELPIRY